MKKIEIYLLSQILKSFFLIFFIFIGISWLLQATRLLNLITIHKISIVKIFFLSINIIPNIIITILPFIIFFSMFLTCVKLYKDKELIAAYTLGLNLKEIIKPFIVFALIAYLSSLLLSLFISPYYYDIFKNNEFNLRTNLDIENIGLNSFYDFNDEVVIHFEKENDEYTNLLIFQKIPKKNIIIADRARMNLEKNILNLQLNNGYKTEIKDTSNETLIYDKYNFSLNLDNNQTYNNYDTNTFNILKLIKEKGIKNYLIINQRFVDSLIILSLIFFIAKYILINLNFNLLNLLLVTLSCLLIIFFDNILGNLSMNNYFYIFLMYVNILLPFFTNLLFKPVFFKLRSI